MGQCKTERLPVRMDEHRRGAGAAITRAAAERGIGFYLVRLWPGQGISLERRLKIRGHFNRHCPVCMAGGNHLVAYPHWPAIVPFKVQGDWVSQQWPSPISLARSPPKEKEPPDTLAAPSLFPVVR